MMMMVMMMMIYIYISVYQHEMWLSRLIGHIYMKIPDQATNIYIDDDI
jgi:hypothetical protein